MGGTRNPNFSEAEIQILLDDVEKNRTVIFSKLSNIVTNNQKKRVWKSIGDKVNSVNTRRHVRTVEEVRKKFSTYTSETKKKIADSRREAARTGGGMTPPSELTPFQEKVSGILGNTPIDGIEGGLETCGDTSSSSMSSSLSSCRDADNTDHSVETPSRPMKKLRLTGKEGYEESLLKIEGQKLEVQRERLRIETERLDVERQRLAVEQQRLLIEQQRHTVYLAQRGVTFEGTEN